jgi:hypothetical protein
MSEVTKSFEIFKANMPHPFSASLASDVVPFPTEHASSEAISDFHAKLGKQPLVDDGTFHELLNRT